MSERNFLIIWDWAGTIRLQSRDGSPAINPVALQWLDIFRTHKSIQCVVSNESNHDRLLKQITELDLSSYFSRRIFSPNNKYRPKPYPDLYYALAKEIDTAAKDIIFVGDSLTDKEFAEAVGIKFVQISEIMHLDLFK